MKISIIGAGNIGGAVALGLAGGGMTRPEEICVTARHSERLERFAKAGIITTTDNGEAAAGADILCIAVKPWQVEEMLSAMKPSIEPYTLIVSLAPGVSAQTLQNALPEGQRLAYAIPNTAIEIGEGMTYISSVNAEKKDLALLRSIFRSAGDAQIVPLEQMLSGTSLASCGIAYAMKFIEASAAAGEGLGLDGKEALEAACRTAIGAASLILAHGALPSEEIRKVTTPNGLTERGLKAMEEAGFSEAVAKGINAVKK